MSDPPPRLSQLAESLVGEFRGLPSPASPRHTIGGFSARTKDRPTQPLAAVVEQLAAKYQLGQDTVEHAIRARWPEIVGPANATYSHPVAITNSRLLVLVSHGVVRNELFLHRDAILARLRQIPGCTTVKSLNLRAG